MTILVRMVAAAAFLSIVLYRQDTSLLCAHAFVPICSSSMVLGARDMNLNVPGVRRRYGVFGSVGLMLEPLGKEGEWTAYMDEDNTEDVYYFNERTGERRWDPPSESFPKIDVNKMDDNGDYGDYGDYYDDGDDGDDSDDDDDGGFLETVKNFFCFFACFCKVKIKGRV
mmetsp:Transcript_2458/g.2314  ORF Transcript_2458/g.2314 Transcript_2458/m.2314 type:complete len:169 (-) Transcript_2458:117-623(-)